MPALEESLIQEAIAPQLRHLLAQMRDQAPWLASARDEDMLERGVKPSVLQTIELKQLRKVALALQMSRPKSLLLTDVLDACAHNARALVREGVQEVLALRGDVQAHNRGGDANEFYRQWDARTYRLRLLASGPLEAERTHVYTVPRELEVWHDCLSTLDDWALDVALHKHELGEAQERKLLSVAKLERLVRQLDVVAGIFADWIANH